MLMDIKAEINSNTITVEDYNAPFTSMDGSSREKINMEIMALNVTCAQVDLMTFLEHFIQNHKIHIFLKYTFLRIDHVVYCKTNLHKFNTIEIISSIFSDHNSVKPEIIYRKKTKK